MYPNSSDSRPCVANVNSGIKKQDTEIKAEIKAKQDISPERHKTQHSIEDTGMAKREREL